jgi:hypothetical protein
MAHPLEVWAQIRADYEVRGMSLRALAKKHDVALTRISLHAKREQWEMGKREHLIKNKVQAIKDIMKIEEEKGTLSTIQQLTVDNSVENILRVEGLRIGALSEVLYRIKSEASKIPLETARDLESYGKTASYLAGEKPSNTTTVNVAQQTNVKQLDISELSHTEIASLNKIRATQQRGLV